MKTYKKPTEICIKLTYKNTVYIHWFDEVTQQRSLNTNNFPLC